MFDAGRINSWRTFEGTVLCQQLIETKLFKGAGCQVEVTSA